MVASAPVVPLQKEQLPSAQGFFRVLTPTPHTVEAEFGVGTLVGPKASVLRFPVEINEMIYAVGHDAGAYEISESEVFSELAMFHCSTYATVPCRA
jgi:hypothetical protein